MTKGEEDNEERMESLILHLRTSFDVLESHLTPGARGIFKVALKRDLDMVIKMCGVGLDGSEV